MEAPSSPQVGLPQEERRAREKDVRKQVRDVLGDILYPQDSLSVERRRLFRHPFPQPLCLTFPGEDESDPKGEPIMVVAKDISESGIGFFHAVPLPSKQMVVSLQAAKGRRVAFIIEVTWSHNIRQGWYESGARFLRPVALPSKESA
jgi:hypothetical protein